LPINILSEVWLREVERNLKHSPGLPMTLDNMRELQRGANVSRKSARFSVENHKLKR
jgi:hypothetical protein